MAKALHLRNFKKTVGYKHTDKYTNKKKYEIRGENDEQHFVRFEHAKE